MNRWPTLPATDKKARMDKVTCPSCTKTNTAAIYYHRCIDKDWFTVVPRAEVEGPGRGNPSPVPCPDGLITRSNRDDITLRSNATRRDCDNADHDAHAIALYCFDCGIVTAVYSPRRPGNHHHTRK